MLENAAHLQPGHCEIATERLGVALDQTEVGERDRQIRVRIDFARRGPPQLAACLGSRRSFDRARTEQMDEVVKATGRYALDLVHGLGSHVMCAVTRLFDKLASRRVLKTLVPLHVPAGEEPFTSERPGCLLDEEDASGVIDTRDDRTDGRPIGHVR